MWEIRYLHIFLINYWQEIVLTVASRFQVFSHASCSVLTSENISYGQVPGEVTEEVAYSVFVYNNRCPFQDLSVKYGI